jgi:hypothetical protein
MNPEPNASESSDAILSAAHSLLLSKFAHPRGLDGFPDDSPWTAALGETPRRAIQRFVGCGLLIVEDLKGCLAYRFTSKQLRQLLRERKLSASGRKDELAARLVQADPDGIRESAGNLTVFRESDKGRELSQQFCAAEATKRRQVEEQVLVALQVGEFEAASRLVSTYESQQPFARGVNIDWTSIDHANTAAYLSFVCSCRPRILGKLDEIQVRQLRLAAGMMHLWGARDASSWLPDDFKTGLVMDGHSAARMILFYVSHIRELANYRALAASGFAKIIYIEISRCGDSCSCQACARMARRKYALKDVPELPFGECTSEMGCRCVMLPRFDWNRDMLAAAGAALP